MKQEVIIIGGGIVGILSAYFLNKDGFKVKVIEKRKGVGFGASFANGSQISFSHILPTFFISANKFFGRFQKSCISSFINKSSPQVKNFLAKQREEILHEDKHLESLISLADTSYEALNQIIKDEKIERYIKECGIIHLSTKPIKSDKFPLFGQPFEILNRKKILELEPNVETFAKNFNHGAYFKQDKTSNCHDLCKVLEAILQEKGVEFYYNEEVAGFETQNNTITAVKLKNKDSLKANFFIVANGCDSPALLSTINVNCDVFPVRGYSYTFNVEKVNYAPFLGLIDREKRMVFSLYKTYLRVAGFMDLGVNEPTQITKRMQDFENEIFLSMPLLKRNTIVHKWTENRPFSSNSVPIIGKPQEFQNLLINTGHGSLGFTLSFGAGKIISDII